MMIWNLVPAKYEEAISLIPSLKDKPKDVVEGFIETVNKYKSWIINYLKSSSLTHSFVNISFIELLAILD